MTEEIKEGKTGRRNDVRRRRGRKGSQKEGERMRMGKRRERVRRS